MFDDSSNVWDIGCNVNLVNNDGTNLAPTGNVYFESCIRLCSSYAVSLCYGVDWQKASADGLGSCTGRVTIGGALPNNPPLLRGRNNTPVPNGVGTRLFARLLTGQTRNKLDDALWFLGNAPAYNLGLCGSGSAYSQSFVVIQTRSTGNNSYNGQFTTDGYATYLILCDGRNFTPDQAPLNTASQWLIRYPSETSNYKGPQSPDDCARLCYWTRTADYNASSSTVDTNNQCSSWIWSTATNDAAGNDGVPKCWIFKSVNTATVSGSLQLVPRYYTTATTNLKFDSNNVLAAGGWTSGVNQQGEILTYKRSIGIENGPPGRYKKDIVVRDDRSDSLRPDLILKAADWPIDSDFD
ncbi:uncharacterized protein AB675_5791 [Cyphellophora attinorum]|uniref:Uncharacterized protein n=1 Tax=Cyphellophora attinorum TaxID=1664694 RepID=A0A0N1H2R0_9EURO|nr:uncharacterized protein AB675_5791 [Phialophora attinorum]KPI38855.1 hypothetical protein AB675_5791 [Phialophora attinorum]